MSGTVSSTLTASGTGGTNGTINIPDYTSELGRIATALETIATQSTTIAAQTTTIATQTTTLASRLTDIEAHQQKLRELGEGPGIHVISPYEWFSLITTYRLLIDQGKIFEDPSTLTPEQLQSAKNAVNSFINRIRELPTLF
jgi:hypothetical protein